jgi:hypothetical protein
MEVLHEMNICPQPKEINYKDYEMEICMDFAGIDFDNRISIDEKQNLEQAIDKLSSILEQTNLLFVDLCLHFNPGNIVYNNITKQVLLIDIDINWIRLAKDIPDNYWKNVLNVYKEYALRKDDQNQDQDQDPYDIFNDKLQAINKKHLKESILSQAISSIDINKDDINQSLFIKKPSTPLEKLFNGISKTTPFEGTFPTKAHYITKTIEAKQLFKN